MHGEELAGLTAAIAEPGENLERLAVHHVHALVLAVGEVEILLLRVARERDVPHRTVAAGFLGHAHFLHELAVLLEHLDTVVRTVADVHEPVARGLRAVHRVPELLGQRRRGVVRRHAGVIGLVAVGAPVALDATAARVDHRDALVAVPVGHVGLAGLGVERDLGHAPEVRGVVAVRRLFGRAVLGEELAVVAELEDVRIRGAIAADPHVVLVIDGHAVVRRGPVVTRTGAAPCLHEVAGGVELENGRGRAAALADGRGGVGAGFRALVERGITAMNDEHVVAAVHAHADHRPEDPVVGQRLGPEGIDLEFRGLHRLTVVGLQRRLSGTEGGEGNGEHGPTCRGAELRHRVLRRGQGIVAGRCTTRAPVVISGSLRAAAHRGRETVTPASGQSWPTC